MKLNRTDGDFSRTRKLCQRQVDEIRGMKGKKTPVQLAKDYGVHWQTISKILRGQTWRQNSEGMPNERNKTTG